jgi:hypothetical protein
MQTLNISISDMEFNHLGIKNENITFHEFTELVKREVMRNNLNNCVALAAIHRADFLVSWNLKHN